MQESTSAIFDYLVWAGAAITLTGLGLLVWCILLVARARPEADEARLRAVLRRIVPINLGALFLSIAGLMLVVVGLLLGSPS